MAMRYMFLNLFVRVVAGRKSVGSLEEEEGCEVVAELVDEDENAAVLGDGTLVSLDEVVNGRDAKRKYRCLRSSSCILHDGLGVCEDGDGCANAAVRGCVDFGFGFEFELAMSTPELDDS